MLVDTVGEDEFKFVPAIEAAPELAHFSITCCHEGSNHFLGNGAISLVVHGAFGIPDIEAIASCCCSFLGGYPVVMRPVPGGAVDIEKVVVCHACDIGDFENFVPIGGRGSGIKAGDHIVPSNFVAFGNVVISFELENVPLSVGIGAVERLKEWFPEALDHVVEAFEFAIDVKAIDNAQASAISHFVTEAPE